MNQDVRRRKLASRLGDLGVDAFLVTRLPNVRYLTGFTGSNGQLIVTAEEAIFLTDGRYGEQSRREAPDLRRVVYTGEFVRAFTDACSDLGVERLAFESAGLTYKTYQDLSAVGRELVPTEQEVERLRWVKDREEIDRLNQAQALADDAFDLITHKLVEGMTERDAAFELDMSLRRAGAENVAFETIMAFGESAAEPHHHPSDRPLQRGDIVKMDFGCVVDGYHSDMTRTFSFGDPPAQLREVYDVVRVAQQAGIGAVAAGVSGADADEASRSVIRDAGYGDKFTHSLGHGVGLEIHEGPTLRAGGKDVVPEGAVVTVEPGIYLEGLGGVRIEDMVEVRSDGCRVIPRTPKELIVL
ncbi:MAG TPA: aminopeptidase P family protein [Actinomycetota bacterium]|nr:aminopeptidase P family protein [Actinomycetota bacterium]